MRNTIPNVPAGTIRKHRPVYQVALYVSLLLLLGLVVMYALGPQRANVMNFAYGTNYGDMFFFNKQLISVVISFAAFAACAIIPYKIFTEKYANWLFVGGLFFCFLLVALGMLGVSFAQETNGAYRWFYLGGLGSFQPAELLKFGILVFIAGFLGKRMRQGKINDVEETLIPLGIAAAIAMFIVVVLQKDLGTGLALVAIVLSMLVVSGMRSDILWKIVGVLLAAGVMLILIAPHRLERVMTFFQGDHSNTSSMDSSSNTYHVQQARITIGSGGILGLGIGKSVQVSGYLPEAINDSIFAIMGETFGFVGLLIILGLFTALLLGILHIAARLPDPRLRLVAAGVFGWVASHVILNVAAMTGVAPLTGIPLPLLSYGGTSMLFIAAALGLVFQLSCYTSHKPLTEGKDSYADLSGRRRFGRTRYARGRRV